MCACVCTWRACGHSTKHANLFMWVQCSWGPEEGNRFPLRWSYRWLWAFGYRCWTLTLVFCNSSTFNYWVFFPTPFFICCVFKNLPSILLSSYVIAVPLHFSIINSVQVLYKLSRILMKPKWKKQHQLPCRH